MGDATGERQVRRVVSVGPWPGTGYRPLSRHRTPHRETDNDDAIAAQHIILASNFKQAKQSCAILTQQMTNRCNAVQDWKDKGFKGFTQNAIIFILA